MFPKAEVEIREKQNHRYSFSGKSDFKRDLLVGRSSVSPKIALMNRYLKNESVSRCRNQSQS